MKRQIEPERSQSAVSCLRQIAKDARSDDALVGRKNGKISLADERLHFRYRSIRDISTVAEQAAKAADRVDPGAVINMEQARWVVAALLAGGKNRGELVASAINVFRGSYEKCLGQDPDSGSGVCVSVVLAEEAPMEPDSEPTDDQKDARSSSDPCPITRRSAQLPQT